MALAYGPVLQDICEFCGKGWIYQSVPSDVLIYTPGCTNTMRVSIKLGNCWLRDFLPMLVSSSGLVMVELQIMARLHFENFGSPFERDYFHFSAPFNASDCT